MAKKKIKKKLIKLIQRGNEKLNEAMAKLAELEGVLSKDFLKEFKKLARAGKDYIAVEELLVPSDAKPKKKKKKKKGDDDKKKKKKKKKDKDKKKKAGKKKKKKD